MQIRPTNNVQSAQSVNLQTNNTAQKSSNSLPVDQLDISAEAQMLSHSQSADGIRHDRVAEIRTQIAEGTYATDAKLDAAVARMLDEIA